MVDVVLGCVVVNVVGCHACTGVHWSSGEQINSRTAARRATGELVPLIVSRLPFPRALLYHFSVSSAADSFGCVVVLHFFLHLNHHYVCRPARVVAIIRFALLAIIVVAFFFLVVKTASSA